MASTRLIQGDAYEGLRSFRNYISNSTFELGILKGWATYADAAATTPVDGTGGSPNVTFAIQSGSLIRNAFCARLTKDAANRQGQGASFDFTIDAADKSKPLLITFDFIASANYAANDIGIYIYDVTNGTLITPAQVNVPAGSGSINSFFVATTSTSYRLILHVASTNASAYTLDVDNFYVGNGSLGVGYSGTDPVSYAITSPQGLGTLASTQATWTKFGKYMHIQARFTTGTTGASEARIALPTGYTVASDLTQLTMTGRWSRNSSTANDRKRGVMLMQAGNSYLTFGSEEYAIAASPFTAQNGSTLFNTGEVVTFEALVSIEQWSSNVTMADRQVEEYAWNSSTSTTTDTSSFGYGPGGVLFQAFAPAGTNSVDKTVQFQTSIQATDALIVEILQNASGAWIPLNQRFSGFFQNDAGTTNYGYQISSTSGTQAVVSFFSRATVSTPWSDLTAFRWRVRKVSSGGMVGYPIASSNIVGRTDGLAPSAGYVGQIIRGAGIRSFGSNDTDGQGWVLTPTTASVLDSGTWLITTQTQIAVTSGTTSGTRAWTITTDTADGWGPTVNLGTSMGNTNFPPAATAVGAISTSRTDIVVVPANTSYSVRVKMYADIHTTFTGSYEYFLTAVRIA